MSFLSLSKLLTAALSASAVVAQNVQQRQPNIVFILTDDQDEQLGSLDYMPFVQKHFVNEGTYYRKHFCTISICCPSRVSLLTGQAAHNTNVTYVTPPHGEQSLSHPIARLSNRHVIQVDILSSSLRDTMRSICLSGCRMLVTTLTTRASSSTPIAPTTGTTPTLRVGQEVIVSIREAKYALNSANFAAQSCLIPIPTFT